MHSGTHGIRDVVITPDFQVSTIYSDQAPESGCLVVLLSDDVNSEFVNFTRSVTFAIDNTTSLNYTLPVELFPGRYRVLFYDVEQDGMLFTGTTYPAFDGYIFSSANSEGKLMIQ